MRKIIILCLALLVALPTVSNAVPQVVGGSKEENQKLEEYFKNPGSSSVKDVDDSAALEKAWYKGAKAEVKKARAAALAAYKKNMAEADKELQKIIKKSYQIQVKAYDATDYALDKVHNDILKKRYKYDVQIISKKILQYTKEYMKKK
ncbi:hypothetical protein [Cohnella cholangitidis]|uniref:Uncharacterized protein n=1 Tax=Cohnella cholangitidis TaxID=2598458 RepID=A0A7G5C237_9BACL|nr:hypothetical protein [Cohnella cholangitidis]QMV43271.1 hypothetical protein FPL14_20360 [Cohnella cholangitidis]